MRVWGYVRARLREPSTYVGLSLAFGEVESWQAHHSAVQAARVACAMIAVFARSPGNTWTHDDSFPHATEK